MDLHQWKTKSCVKIFNLFQLGIFKLIQKCYGNIKNYYRAETKVDIHLSKDGNDGVKQGCHMGL